MGYSSVEKLIHLSKLHPVLFIGDRKAFLGKFRVDIIRPSTNWLDEHQFRNILPSKVVNWRKKSQENPKHLFFAFCFFLPVLL